MKPTSIFFILLVTAGITFAQEQLTAEHLEKVVPILGQSAGELKDLQLKLELDTTKPVGIKGSGDVGLVAIPDKALTADALAKVGKELMPIGQLWMRGAAPAKDGKVVQGDQLRQLNIRTGDKETRLQLYLLGARRTDKKLELVIFAKSKEPLLILPMEPGEAAQDMPIELAGKGEKGNEESAAIILKFLGKFKSTMPVRSYHD